MAWTYSQNPAHSLRDRVRFIAGDTDENDQMASNEEIAWLIDEVGGSPYQLARYLLVVCAAKYARLADQSSGDLSVSLSQKAEGLREQAKSVMTLQRRHGGVPRPIAGGMSYSEKETDEEDEDLIMSRFFRDMFRGEETIGLDDQYRIQAGDYGRVR